jgi:Zn-dependent peptidase ImmA (M78 family)/DNA-binding XRE family transcriptional regulator
MRLSIDEAAHRAKVRKEVLFSWEKGISKPTIRQARIAAKAYKIPFASLFLSSPPDLTLNLPHDYRRIAGTTINYISSDLLCLIQEAWDRRDIALEIYETEKISPKNIHRSLDIENDSEASGNYLREVLDVSLENQRSWHDPRKGFNCWRLSIEELGILVFQDSGIDLRELRGFSLNARPLPVIMVNRIDSFTGRSFTLIHELAHILLRGEGICNLLSSPHQLPEDQNIEIYCNAVAAACLIPSSEFLRHPLLHITRRLDQWSEDEIAQLANYFSVSRESIVRRLLTFHRTSQEFYENKRREYSALPKKKKLAKGHIPPSVDTISRLGKPYVSLVIGAYNNKAVTSSDASDFLGIKGKHFSRIAEIIGVG